VREQHRTIHAEADALLPETGIRFVGGDDHHAGSSTEPGRHRAGDQRRVDEHQRCGTP